MITLVLGGIRSGKSAVAERIAAAAGAGPVTYVATGSATDDAMAGRIAAHRARRPADWDTLEVASAEEAASVLRSTPGTVLLDSLGTLLARSDALELDAGPLCDALVGRDGDAVVVSEEVGLSVHPATEAGRRFADSLGTLNQAVAGVADEVLLVVAGRTLSL